MTQGAQKAVLAGFIVLGILDFTYGIFTRDAISLVIGPTMAGVAAFVLARHKSSGKEL